jgi:hypothetical protein
MWERIIKGLLRYLEIYKVYSLLNASITKREALKNHTLSVVIDNQYFICHAVFFELNHRGSNLHP